MMAVGKAAGPPALPVEPSRPAAAARDEQARVQRPYVRARERAHVGGPAAVARAAAALPAAVESRVRSEPPRGPALKTLRADLDEQLRRSGRHGDVGLDAIPGAAGGDGRVGAAGGADRHHVHRAHAGGAVKVCSSPVKAKVCTAAPALAAPNAVQATATPMMAPPRRNVLMQPILPRLLTFRQLLSADSYRTPPVSATRLTSIACADFGAILTAR